MNLNDEVTITTSVSELIRAYAALSIFNGRDHQGFENCLWNVIDEMFPLANEAHDLFISGKDKRDVCRYDAYQKDFENFILGTSETEQQRKIRELEETRNYQ